MITSPHIEQFPVMLTSPHYSILIRVRIIFRLVSLACNNFSVDVSNNLVAVTISFCDGGSANRFSFSIRLVVFSFLMSALISTTRLVNSSFDNSGGRFIIFSHGLSTVYHIQFSWPPTKITYFLYKILYTFRLYTQSHILPYTLFDDTGCVLIHNIHFSMIQIFPVIF